MTRSRFGSIRKVGESRWEVRWTSGGVRRSKVVHGTKADASKALAMAEMESGEIERDARWGEYWELRVEPSLEGLQAATIADYRKSWRALAPWISEEWVSKAAPRWCERVLAHYSPGMAPHHARLLKKMCRMAVADGMLARDPFATLRVKAAPRKPKALLAAEDVKPWMEAIRGLKYEPVLLCELGGGLRHEEACALTWEDVTEWAHDGRVYAILSVSKALVVVEGHKYLKEPKTAFSGRESVLGEPFASRLLELSAGKSGPLLPSGIIDHANAAAPYSSPVTLTHNWKAWCAAHGVAYVPPKNLRSTFATLHGEAGSPDSLVSGAMGHADGSTKARHYQTITRKGLALIADNLAEHLGEG